MHPVFTVEGKLIFQERADPGTNKHSLIKELYCMYTSIYACIGINAGLVQQYSRVDDPKILEYIALKCKTIHSNVEIPDTRQHKDIFYH
jgi:hypothetical protein